MSYKFSSVIKSKSHIGQNAHLRHGQSFQTSLYEDACFFHLHQCISRSHSYLPQRKIFNKFHKKNLLPDGCLPFLQYLLPPSADPHLHCHKLFPLRHMSKALLKSRQIVSTMFCLENEFSLHADIKVAWKNLHLIHLCCILFNFPFIS